ncbi:MAG: flagellar hook-length control protein FliK [Acidobacteria bacterium]|nr:flagellar hook-length control protein FliK [Acidobacteriota bacterium]
MLNKIQIIQGAHAAKTSPKGRGTLADILFGHVLASAMRTATGKTPIAAAPKAEAPAPPAVTAIAPSIGDAKQPAAPIIAVWTRTAAPLVTSSASQLPIHPVVPASPVAAPLPVAKTTTAATASAKPAHVVPQAVAPRVQVLKSPGAKAKAVVAEAALPAARVIPAAPQPQPLVVKASPHPGEPVVHAAVAAAVASKPTPRAAAVSLAPRASVVVAAPVTAPARTPDQAPAAPAPAHRAVAPAHPEPARVAEVAAHPLFRVVAPPVSPRIVARSHARAERLEPAPEISKPVVAPAPSGDRKPGSNPREPRPETTVRSETPVTSERKVVPHDAGEPLPAKVAPFHVEHDTNPSPKSDPHTAPLPTRVAAGNERVQSVTHDWPHATGRTLEMRVASTEGAHVDVRARLEAGSVRAEIHAADPTVQATLTQNLDGMRRHLDALGVAVASLEVRSDGTPARRDGRESREPDESGESRVAEVTSPGSRAPRRAHPARIDYVA